MRARTLMLAVLALVAPLSARAALTLTSYSVAPAIIYPAASSPILATSSTIAFGFSAKAKVSLKVLDASGKSIRTLYTSSGVIAPDPKIWDGRDSSGAVVLPGIFTLALAATSTATSTDFLYDTNKTIEVAFQPVAPAPDFSTQSYSLPLSSGWNLLSVPLVPSDSSAAHIFSDPAIDAVWSYDPSNPAAVNGWLLYSPAHPELSNLAAVAIGNGYFVETHAAGALAGTGTPYLSPGRTPPLRALAAGWSLVGSFATSSEEIDRAFASIGWAGLDYTALYALMPGTFSLDLPHLIEPGGAYWIFTPQTAAYAPSNL